MTDTSAADRVIWESNRVEAVERGKRRIVRRPGWHRLRAWPIRDAIKRMDWMDHQWSFTFWKRIFSKFSEWVVVGRAPRPRAAPSLFLFFYFFVLMKAK